MGSFSQTRNMVMEAGWQGANVNGVDLQAMFGPLWLILTDFESQTPSKSLKWFQYTSNKSNMIVFSSSLMVEIYYGTRKNNPTWNLPNYFLFFGVQNGMTFGREKLPCEISKAQQGSTPLSPASQNGNPAPQNGAMETPKLTQQGT